MTMTTSPLFAKRGDKSEIETGTSLQPKFDSDGLIAAVVTDFETGEVLMVGYMNAEALKRTIDTGEAWYWSRSRQEFWKKGGTSGQVQKVQEIRTDCDQDAIWLKVSVKGNGATCHVGFRSCFFRKIVKHEDGRVELIRTEAGRVYDPKDIYGNK
ncbi:phosphoribosyl-AMP cyclohydrolase [Roseibium polysiphoniae]|uniref:Phosphoribosyl-AMP cyclohydrolase n=1 Tax=Roseibium polysiphoniae TaxID=2571221 RepID=A0ABR9C9K3_9HYPH|nr:phosphoribosyl-AMP cyclohydrolase [Roseibium polysiphoniae]MBD8876582.1 phosphoribosyl-AMP cyclohydrolase [Roseibium polysiphoniae]